MATETLLGLALGELLKAVEKLMGSIQEYDSILKQLQTTLKQMIPIVEDIHNLNIELDHRQDGKTTLVLSQKIVEGQKLVQKCNSEMEGCFCPCLKKPRYAKDLQNIYSSIKDFCDIFVQLQIHKKVIEIDKGVRKIEADVGTLLKQKTPPKEDEGGGGGLDIGAPQVQGKTLSAESGGSTEFEQLEQEQPQLGSEGYKASVNNVPSNGQKITKTTENGASKSIPPVPFENPKVARETESKVCGSFYPDQPTHLSSRSVALEPPPKVFRGFPDEAKDKPTLPVRAKLPDDTEADKRLSKKDTSSAPIAPPVYSRLVDASIEHDLPTKRSGNTLKGKNVESMPSVYLEDHMEDIIPKGRGRFNQVQKTNSALNSDTDYY